MSSTATATATATSSGIKISPYLFLSDKIVLEKLIEDAKSADVENNPDDAAIAKLAALCDPTSDDFEVTVFTSWDLRDLVKSLPPSVNRYLLQPYIRWGSTVVRRNTDVVFITHVLLYLSTIFPSAILLYRHFSWYHGVAHTVWAVLNAGPFTLMLHNHIHNNGVLAPSWWVLDKLFPYILEPLFGHTWDSYFYHHVKHHHAEGNGPDDLSSTIRYQRDELTHFLMYLGRFMFLAWIELPIYFLRKKRYGLAARSLVTELTAYSFVVAMARYSFRPSLFVFILPLVIMRIGMMLGNWGQHAFVDEDEPMSSLRSSITLIDIASNRHSFNDGYHTSHHLNPRRHWRDHQEAFMKAKTQYAEGRSLVFHDIDYLFLTITLLRKDYDRLADCLVPMGDMVGKSKKELADILRTKTIRFTEEDIKNKFLADKHYE